MDHTRMCTGKTDAWRTHPMFNAQENLKRMFPGLGTGMCETVYVRIMRTSVQAFPNLFTQYSHIATRELQ